MRGATKGRAQEQLHQQQLHQQQLHQLLHQLQQQPRLPSSPSSYLPMVQTLTMASLLDLPGNLSHTLSLKSAEFVDLSRLRRTRPSFVSLLAPTSSKTPF